MRELALLVWLAGPASAHPGAHQHLQATESDACDPDVRSRRAAALIDENLLDAARAELERGRDCPLPSIGATVAEAQLAIALHDYAVAETLMTEVLRTEPGHAGALLYRIQARTRLGKNALAADDALQLARQGHPGPSMYQQALENLAATDDVQRFHQVCDEAIQTLGPLPALTLRIGELNLAAGRADRALDWVAEPISPSHAMLRARALDQHDPSAAPEAWQVALGKVQAMRASPKRNQLLTEIREHLPEATL